MRGAAPELKFTLEKAENGILQFLDLRIHVEGGLCWEYGKMAAKPVLSRNSCHAKSVKSGVVRSLISNALDKSCAHFMGYAVERQWSRLEDAGYDSVFIKRQLELQQKAKQRPEKETKRHYAVIPYFHGISHNLKACAKKFGVDVAFKSDFKLNRLTPFQTTQKVCPKAHRDKSVDCKEGVVYEIPLECGFKYVGQTARCVNDRLVEHKRNVKINAPNSEIAKHISECNDCTAHWSQTDIIHRERNNTKRLIKETVRIKSIGNCISHASMQLGSSSKKFLKM